MVVGIPAFNFGTFIGFFREKWRAVGVGLDAREPSSVAECSLKRYLVTYLKYLKYLKYLLTISNISNISWHYFSSCLSEMVFVMRKFVQRTASLHGGVVRLPFT